MSRPAGAAPRYRVLAAVATFERADLSATAVASLAALPDAIDVEVVVIDDGSSAAGRDSLRSALGDRVRVHWRQANGGYAAVCNDALRLGWQGGHDAVWLLNNDLTFEPGCIAGLVAALEAGPEVAAVAPVTLDAAGRTVLGAGVDYDPWRGRVRHRLVGRPPAALPEAPADVPCLEAASLLIRRSAIASVGGFDEAFGMYWEDTDWCLRARRAGWRLRVVPAARVRHLVSQSTTGRLRTVLLIRNRVRLVRRHGTPAQQVVFLAYFCLGWLPAYLLFRLLPRFGRDGLGIAREVVGWNLADARRRGRWRLRRSDQVIPDLTSATGGPGA